MSGVFKVFPLDDTGGFEHNVEPPSPLPRDMRVVTSSMSGVLTSGDAQGLVFNVYGQPSLLPTLPAMIRG